ncbi:uncharacterized protein L199_005369 [Kwoniella botswanensis]|uniref:uncharacterized protein n=1 Tax=Kwoniella botswanensis TaxID=1268659 RepID=UPI00315D5476
MSDRSTNTSSTPIDDSSSSKTYAIIAIIAFLVLTIISLLIFYVHRRKYVGRGMFGIKPRCKHCKETLDDDEKTHRPGKFLCMKSRVWYHKYCIREIESA